MIQKRGYDAAVIGGLEVMMLLQIIISVRYDSGLEF